MGCGGSTENKPIDARRRRLSLDITNRDEDTGSVSEIDGGQLIAELNEQQLMSLVNNLNEEGRKYSVGSENDKDAEDRPSFAKKTMSEQCRNAAGQEEAVPSAGSNSGVGFTCRKGLKPESPNQDAFLILRVENDFSLYGVFDGHGFRGHEISHFVKDTMPKVLLRDPDFRTDPAKCLTNAFRRLQKMLEVATSTAKVIATSSGTTASIILHRHTDNRIFVAHAGDSRCVLGRTDGMLKKCTAIDLTLDHRPELKEEKARILKSGGVVIHDGFSNNRVYSKGASYPGLKKTRSIGDVRGHEEAGITEEPTLYDEALQPGKDLVLLLCTDGVWEFISSQEAIDIVSKYKPEQATEAAEELATKAWDKWMKEEKGELVDDITVITILFQGS